MLNALWDERGGSADPPLHGLARRLLDVASEVTDRLAEGQEVSAEVHHLEELCVTAGSGWLAGWIRRAVGSGSGRWRGATTVLRAVAEGPLDRALDAVTDEYLGLVGAVWDLGPLVREIGPAGDLAVEVDDILHAVPVAFLPVRDGESSSRLFTRVRTVRSSLSLLLALNRAEMPTCGGVATVSWFDPTDPSREGARWLHHGHRLLAARHELPWRAAGDHPAGCPAAVDRLIEPGVDVLSVCGHGRLFGAGVRLRAGEVWTGSERLDRVGWLILASCSVGRVQQSSLAPDVSGFVAALAAHGARGALACRWPVHSLQAAGFANLAAGEYLGAPKDPSIAPRAAALARARAICTGRKAPYRNRIGLNTLAAFELYGDG
jgi:hypothetical protein